MRDRDPAPALAGINLDRLNKTVLVLNKTAIRVPMTKLIFEVKIDSLSTWRTEAEVTVKIFAALLFRIESVPAAQTL